MTTSTRSSARQTTERVLHSSIARVHRLIRTVLLSALAFLIGLGGVVLEGATPAGASVSQVLSSPVGSVRGLLRRMGVGAMALFLALSLFALTGAGPASASETTSPPDTVTDLSAVLTGLGTVQVHFTLPNLHGEELAAYIVAAYGPNGEEKGYYADESGNATFTGLTSGTWSFKEITVASPAWSELSNVVEVNVATAPGAPTDVLTYTSTVSVGNGPYTVAVNPSTNTVYVPNFSDGNVSVINGSTNDVTTTVSVGNGAGSVAVNPSTNTVYVTNASDNTVSVIDGSTNEVTATVSVGNYPFAVAVNPSTNTVYVTNANDNTVSVIDGSTNEVTATVSVGSGPFGVAVNPSTNTVYVANCYDNSVSVINGSTNKVTATVSVGTCARGVAVNPSTNTVYVANASDNTVSVIDGLTNEVTATVSVGIYPSAVAVNPSTNTVYVANTNADPNDNAMSVIDGSTNKVTSTIAVGSSPSGVAVNPSTNTVYVDNPTDSTVSVIKFASSTPFTPSTPSISNLPGSGIFNGSFTPVVSTTGDGTKSVTSSTTDICTVINGEVNYIGVGTCTLVAQVAQGTNYAGADGSAQSFTVSRASSSTPSITNLPGSSTFGDSFTPVVSTTGDGSTSVTSSTTSVCTVTSGTVNYIGVGTCTLVAHVGEGTNYLAADGESQSFTIAATKPSAPGTPVLTDNHGSFGLAWTAPSNTGGAPVTYSVYVSTNGGVFTQAATGLTATSFTYQGTSGYNTYAFRVRATNAAGSGPLSAYSWLQARPVAPSAPGTPGLTDNHGSFSLTWSQPVTLGDAQVTYSVYVSTNGGVFTQAATGLTATSFTYQGTSAYNTYAFKVRATNAAGPGPLSAYSWLQARNA